MSRCVPAGLKQGQSRHKLGIAINETISQGRMIPVSARRGKPWMPVPGEFIMFALNNQFRVRKVVMISSVVNVKMCADESVDVSGAQAKFGEMLDHVLFVVSFRGALRPGIGSNACIYHNMFAIAGLDEVARENHFHGATLLQGQCGSRQLHEVEFLWPGGRCLHSGIPFVLLAVAFCRSFWQAH
jgi:hypothetical protein